MKHGREASGLSRISLAVAALSLAGFLALALNASGHRLSGLDHHARALVQQARLPIVDAAMTGVSSLGESYGLILLIVLTVALMWRPRRRWAVALPLVMAGTGALQLVAKWAVDRPRPNLAAWGFPSGHVLSLVVFFGLVTYLLATSTAPASRRRLGYAGAAAIVCAVAWSRLHLDAHWLTDVAGGLALGVAYVLAVIWLVEAVGRRRGAGSEAQVELAHDEGGVGDVDTVVVSV